MFCFWPNCSCRELITSESNSDSVCLVGFNFDNDVNVVISNLFCFISSLADNMSVDGGSSSFFGIHFFAACIDLASSVK